MVKGPLRVVMWILGTVGMLWLILWLVSLPAMADMMDGSGMMGGGMNGDGMMAGGMMTMMGAMLLQFAGMLGLAGIFIYLVVDSVRDGSAKHRSGQDASGKGGLG